MRYLNTGKTITELREINLEVFLDTLRMFGQATIRYHDGSLADLKPSGIRAAKILAKRGLVYMTWSAEGYIVWPKPQTN